VRAGLMDLPQEVLAHVMELMEFPLRLHAAQVRAFLALCVGWRG
jgi:hypothetical protein